MDRHNVWSLTSLPAFAAAFSIAGSAAALGGDSLQASAVLLPYPEAYGFRFGVSAALSDDFAIVGDDMFGWTGPQTGAAFITMLDAKSGKWIQRAMLLALDGADDDAFGRTVAIDSGSGIAVVGAPNDDSPLNNAGSAYVYRHVNSTWVFEQKLTANDATTFDFFGSSVAVSGSVIIIGSPQEDSGSSGVGSAYVFRHNGSTWVQDQKLLSPDPSPPNHFSFGCSVAMENGVAVIGEHFGGPGVDGSAHVFTDSGTTWSEQQTLHHSGSAAFGRFGWAVDVQGDLVVIGSPRDEPIIGSSSGSAFVFRRNAGVWAFEQRLQASDAAFNDEFGASVALDGEVIAVGAPFEEPSGSAFDTGSVYRFTSNAGVWTQQQQFRACTLQSLDKFGTAVAASNGRLLASMNASGFARSRATIIEAQFADCNSNGITDICDTVSHDANANAQLDSCEIAAGTSDDCDNNGVPDEAQATVAYRLEDGSFASVTAGGGANEYTLWLNQYHVTSGAETITAVGFRWLWDPAGLPVTVLVYDDPNNDGNPNDAVLLASVNTTNDRSPAEGFGPQRMTIVQVPPTAVGAAGDSFFVGAIMNARVGENLYPMAAEHVAPHHLRSWWAHGPANTAIITNLALNPNPLVTYPTLDFVIHAFASDCNGNGVWDACDISDGVSLDLNGNGLPDECEAICAADIDHSGAVEINDLLAVINAWGPCTAPCPQTPCAADVAGDDCNVNINDLLAVINGWGSCP